MLGRSAGVGVFVFEVIAVCVPRAYAHLLSVMCKLKGNHQTFKDVNIDAVGMQLHIEVSLRDWWESGWFEKKMLSAKMSLDLCFACSNI